MLIRVLLVFSMDFYGCLPDLSWMRLCRIPSELRLGHRLRENELLPWFGGWGSRVRLFGCVGFWFRVSGDTGLGCRGAPADPLREPLKGTLTEPCKKPESPRPLN